MKLFHPTIYKHLRYSLFLILLSFSFKSIGQKVVRNAAGEKIIQYEDGTWRYFEGRDSMLESNLWEDITSDQQAPIEPLPANEIPQYDYRLFQKYIAAAVRYESEMLDKVDQSSDEAHSLEDKLLSLEDSDNPSEIERVKAELDALNDRRQNNQRLLSYARGLIKKILKVGKSEKYEKLAKIYVPGLNTDKELVREDSLMVEDKTGESKVKALPEVSVNPQDVITKLPSDEPSDSVSGTDAREESGEIAKQEEQERPSEEVTEIETDTGSSTDSKTGIPGANPEDLTLQSDTIEIAQFKPVSDPIQQDTPPVKEKKEPLDSNLVTTIAENSPVGENTTPIDDLASREKGEEIGSSTQEMQKDVSPMPGQLSDRIANTGATWFSASDAAAPEYNCEFTFHGIDDFTNTMKKEMKEELFFSYTDERLKPYLKDNDYVVCKGYLTSISGGFRYLTLIFTIASKNAAREYGYIKTGSLLNLKLLDGETVSLFTQSENQGILESKSGYTTYKVRYPIDYQKEKILQKSGVDKVRVVWSSGYEDYEVFNIDFFLNQLNCLNNK